MGNEFEDGPEKEPTMVHDDQLYDVVKDLRTIKSILVFWTVLILLGDLFILLLLIDSSSTTPVFP